MRNFTPTRRLISLVYIMLLAVLDCKSFKLFTCPKPESGDEPLPDIPLTYSTNIRLNYLKQQESVEVRKVVNLKEKKIAIEMWFSDSRHVKYIKDGYKLLRIEYKDQASPNCAVTRSFSFSEILKTEDSGPQKILSFLMEIFETDHQNEFTSLGVQAENNVFINRWEYCSTSPKINVSLGFTEGNWRQTFAVPNDAKYIVYADAQINDIFLTALFSNFNPAVPPDTEFQPPEDAYCDGYRNIYGPPTLPNYFKYDSEVIVFQSSEGIAPVSSYRRVYYDFPAGISRTDSYDTLPPEIEDDVYEPAQAQGVSIIHDFNAGTMYSIDPRTGKCRVSSFTDYIGPSSIETISRTTMPNGDGFFSLHNRNFSYNGQFWTRGYQADVYTGIVQNLNKQNFHYAWYFSSNNTRLVENEIVEKNVLLRMVIRPEAIYGKQGEIDINFYDFVKEEPNPLIFDLTGCYNESYSKEFIFTFPARESLRGVEKLLKTYIHLAIKRVTGVSKQRIFVTEVTFKEKYMYAEFKLLASPEVFGKNLKVKESTLEEAIAKLKESVSSDTFTVPVLSKSNKLIVLKPEPNGLNEMAGDRQRIAKSGYKEGSVIALTIGMLFLGFILGGVTLNLVVSRKFGVSLCMKQQGDSYTQSLHESSI